MSASAILRRRRSLFYQVGLERATTALLLLKVPAPHAHVAAAIEVRPPARARTRRVEGFFASVAVLLDRVALIV